MNYFFTSEFPDAGSGNKLFVYFLGIILSNIHNLPYYHPEIPEMKINENPIKINNLKNYTTNDLSTLFNSKFIDKNLNYNILYTFTPTIEKYDFFKNYINLCKNSYPIKKKNINQEDLVYHFRAGDYFFDGNHYLLNGDKLETLLKNIQYKNFYVVTNLTKKTEWYMDEYKNYRETYLKNGIHAEPYPEHKCVQPNQFQEVLDHINSVINICNKYNCTWISESVYEDFNTIRNFNKIIINVSTLSWWAAVLSNAEEVYVPKRWKYKKNNNKNLAQIDLPGWHQVDL
jgi:hypothetical protein